MICVLHQMLFGLLNQRARDDRGMWHVWERGGKPYRALAES